LFTCLYDRAAPPTFASNLSNYEYVES
jgi:hypothetical protein